MSSLYQALGGSQPSAVQQPSAPVPPASAGSGAGSLDPIDVMGAKYGWGPLQIQHMKDMRGSPPPSQGNMHQALAKVDPYQNLANKATGQDYK